MSETIRLVDADQAVLQPANSRLVPKLENILVDLCNFFCRLVQTASCRLDMLDMLTRYADHDQAVLQTALLTRAKIAKHFRDIR